MSQSDDIQRLVREVWRLNMTLGWGQRVRWEADVGRLAKAAGATPAQVQTWMDGAAQPTTAQALAVLDALPLPVTGVAMLATANGAPDGP